MKLKLFNIFILLLVLTACSSPNTLGQAAEIDWVDFIVLNDIHYIGNYHRDNKLHSEDIQETIGEVKFNVAKNIKVTNYKVKNGDSAYLDKGTKIYRIKGYKPEFRIAVNVEDEWRIYEADTNPKAKKGEDLVDIQNKVKYISINSETDGVTELGSIIEKTKVENMVGMVLAASVNQEFRGNDGQRYFISFHMFDGTDVTRCYWIKSGELARGILLPDDFSNEIKKALSEKSQ